MVRSTAFRRAALCGSATAQAGTRVNAEQASKRAMRKPTHLENGEGRRRTETLRLQSDRTAAAERIADRLRMFGEQGEHRFRLVARRRPLAEFPGD